MSTTIHGITSCHIQGLNCFKGILSGVSGLNYRSNQLLCPYCPILIILLNEQYLANLHIRLINCSSFALSVQRSSPLQVSYVVPVPLAVGCLWTFCPAVKCVKLALSYSSSGVSCFFIQ